MLNGSPTAGVAAPPIRKPETAGANTPPVVRTAVALERLALRWAMVQLCHHQVGDGEQCRRRAEAEHHENDGQDWGGGEGGGHQAGALPP